MLPYSSLMGTELRLINRLALTDPQGKRYNVRRLDMKLDLEPHFKR